MTKITIKEYQEFGVRTGIYISKNKGEYVVCGYCGKAIPKGETTLLLSEDTLERKNHIRYHLNCIRNLGEEILNAIKNKSMDLFIEIVSKNGNNK